MMSSEPVDGQGESPGEFGSNSISEGKLSYLATAPNVSDKARVTLVTNHASEADVGGIP